MTTMVASVSRRLVRRLARGVVVASPTRNVLLPPSFRTSPIRTLTSARPTEEEQQQQVSSSQQGKKDGSTIPRVSKEDEHREEFKRRKLSEVKISEVLNAKHSFRWVDPIISRGATVSEAIVTVIEGGLSGMMVVDDTRNAEKKVAGLLTSRDLLRIMASGIREGDKNDDILNRVVGDYMTPISQVVYGRPDETVGMCRTIMAKLGIKCLPILSKDGRVEGLITARDISDFGLSAKDKGGKKSFLDDVSQRVGLSTNTSMAEPPTYVRDNASPEHGLLYVNVGIAELPHPYKSDDGVGTRQRDLGPRDLSTDPELSEDAYFVTTVKLPQIKGGPILDLTYMGIADGVGSWREYGVDPRAFSHKLMEECHNVLLEAEASSQTGLSQRALTPMEVLGEAYERVKAENIIGSSTACVALFDNVNHQLHFSNLGDSGIIVLRHIDSDVAGSLKRDRHTPRIERVSDLQVAFVSQQQLRSFNHPFQLGWTGEEIVDEESSFKTAKESCTTSIHVRRGDIIIMATDGLFDNVDIDDIVSMALDWEQKNGFIRGGDIAARNRRWKMGNTLSVLSAERIPDLAEQLCERARTNSLDSTLDSPFAILAKENDIMWSGGMPDDCTTIAMHVVGRAADDTMDKDHL